MKTSPRISRWRNALLWHLALSLSCFHGTKCLLLFFASVSRRGWKLHVGINEWTAMNVLLCRKLISFIESFNWENFMHKAEENWKSLMSNFYAMLHKFYESEIFPKHIKSLEKGSVRAQPTVRCQLILLDLSTIINNIKREKCCRPRLVAIHIAFYLFPRLSI